MAHRRLTHNRSITLRVNGQTYVGAGHNVLARCMNADLTRLGY